MTVVQSSGSKVSCSLLPSYIKFQSERRAAVPVILNCFVQPLLQYTMFLPFFFFYVILVINCAPAK